MIISKNKLELWHSTKSSSKDVCVILFKTSTAS